MGALLFTSAVQAGIGVLWQVRAGARVEATPLPSPSPELRGAMARQSFSRRRWKHQP